MHKRDTYTPQPERPPFFWVPTPIGRFCFARRLPSQERLWLNELQGTSDRLHESLDAAKELPPGEAIKALPSITATSEAAQGAYLAHHWVDDAWVLESVDKWRAGEFHASKPWRADAHELRLGMDRYGWSVMEELSLAGLSVEDIGAVLTKVIVGCQSSPQPSQDDLDERESFSDPQAETSTSQ